MNTDTILQDPTYRALDELADTLYAKALAVPGTSAVGFGLRIALAEVRSMQKAIEEAASN